LTGGVLALAALCALAAVTASATVSKPYKASVTPTSVVAGSTFGARVAITNDAHVPLGSANVTVPADLRVLSVDPALETPAGKPWLPATFHAATRTIKLRNPGPGNKKALAKGETVAVSATLRAPCPVSPPKTFRLDTRAKQSNDFNGSGNDLFLADANEPAIAVTGSCRLAVTAAAAEDGTPVAGAPFAIDVDLLDGAGNPMTALDPVPVEICEGGAGAFGGVPLTPAGCSAAIIPAGAVDVIVTGVTFAPPENFVSITATTTTAGILPASTVISVLAAKVTIPAGQTAGSTCVNNDAGPGEVCVRTILPQAATSAVTITERACAGLVGTCQAGLLGEILGDLGFLTKPARGIIEYDKVFAVSKTAPVFFDDLKTPPAGDAVDGPRKIPNCKRREDEHEDDRVLSHTSDPVDPPCVDKRRKDGQGDTVFEVLFKGDPRLFGR
jgi:hypothetical protein